MKDITICRESHSRGAEERGEVTNLVRVRAGELRVFSGQDIVVHIVAGSGRFHVRNGGSVRNWRCRAGDAVIVPRDWTLTMTADVVGEVAAWSTDVATGVAGGPTILKWSASAGPPDPRGECGLAVFHRAVETPYAPGAIVPQQDLTALDATMFAHPDRYRVRRAGPFEYVVQTAPVARAITETAANLLSSAVAGLAVVVEGSQSPLAIKSPCDESDADVLVVVDAVEQLEAGLAALETIRSLQEQVPVPLAPGIVLRSWLRLPYFYSAVDLRASSGDRRWWSASERDRLAEARRRIAAGVRLVRDENEVGAIRDQTLSFLKEAVGFDPCRVAQWRLTPRWLGLEVLANES